MPGNGGANENSHLAPDGVGPDYGKDVRNAFMAGDQQASRCVNVMSPVDEARPGRKRLSLGAYSFALYELAFVICRYIPRTAAV